MTLIRLLLLIAIGYFFWRWLRSLPKRTPGRATEASPASERPQNPYEVLGVARTATADEIHTAYQRLVVQYHPDRVAGMGPEVVAVAERKTKEINEAYAALKR